MSQGFATNRIRFLAVLAFSLVTVSAARADFAYIGYYHSQEVTQLTIGANNTVTGASVIATGYQPEMILNIAGMSGANANQLYVVDATDGSVKSYSSTTGALISNNILLNSAGTQTITLGAGGAAGATLSANGLDFYVAMSNGSNSGIYEFSTATGKQVGFAAFNDVHDVTFQNGYVYATAYQSTTQTGVYRFNADLTGMTHVISANSTNNLYNATGMTFVGNTMYVANSPINGGSSGASFVQEYTVSPTTGAYVLAQTFTSSSKIINPFGMATGPDGNVYVSSLGDIGSQNGQITEINATTGAVTTWLANGAFGGAAGDAPKYLSFNSEAVVYGVPEPGSIVMVGMGLVGMGLIGRNRGRRFNPPIHGTNAPCH